MLLPQTGPHNSFFPNFATMKKQTDTEYIYSLIAEGEHLHQDFKFEISDARKIAKTLSAFANTEGGRLLIGVKDNGNISGIQSDEEQFMMEAAARCYCKPSVDFHMRTYRIGKRCILLAEIPESERKPVYAQDEKGKYWAYLRVKDETVLATSVHLQVWRQNNDLENGLMEYSGRERLLLSLLKDTHDFSLNRYCKLAHLPRKTVECLLAKFIRYGIVELVFERHKFHFRLKWK